MAWVLPTTVATGALLTSAIWEQDVKDNTIALRSGSVAIASQTAGDIIAASSTTQLSRVAAVAAGQVLTSAGTGTVPAYSAAPTLTSVKLTSALNLAEIATPTPIASYGAIYTKTDDKLYFQNGAGAESEVSLGAAAFDSTTVDSTTWSDGANATNTWTFDVSGIDTSLLFGNDALTFGAGTMNVNAPASTHAALNLKSQTANYDATVKVTSGSTNDLSILHLERSDTWTYFKIIHSGNNYGTVLDTGPLSGAFTNFSLSGVVKLAMPANNNFAFTSLLDVATGNEAALTVNYTTNKATSGNDTGLVVNQTDTASPGVSLLADFQVGGASKFSVSNNGAISILETTTPTAVANYGAIYTKTDNLLYFQSGDGVEHQISYA